MKKPSRKVREGAMLPQVCYTVPSHLLVPLQSTCIICPPPPHPSSSCAPLAVVCLRRLPLHLPPVVSPCRLPLSLAPLSLSIPVGGDVAVSTRSALRANAGPSSLLSPPPVVSRYTFTPQAGARSGGGVAPSPLVTVVITVVIPPTIHPTSSCS
jgi:hypothetical protein